MTEARERAIKMYWKMAKEKCPFQTEEIVNGYLEGFIDCAEYLLLQNTELEKENAELKGLKDVATLIRANNDTVVTLMQLNNMLVGKNQQFTKAKKIIQEFLELNYSEFTKTNAVFLHADKFLKELE